ncbi:MAG: hypothetical protein QN194_04680 [Armatimonadota bacterium]|nr:hypothetical protein [Armatimonadota bacterium]
MPRTLCQAMLVALLIAGALGPASPLASGAPSKLTWKGDPQAVAEVQAAFKRFAAARSWRSRTISGEGTTTVAFVAPDRTHTITVRGGKTEEVFVIGGQMWTKTGGSCTKLPISMKLPSPGDLLSLEPEEPTTITVTRGGVETIQGAVMQTYLVTSVTNDLTTRSKIYVAKTGGLVRRIVNLDETPPSTTDFFDYGAPITIRPPC